MTTKVAILLIILSFCGCLHRATHDEMQNHNICYAPQDCGDTEICYFSMPDELEFGYCRGTK